MDGYQGYPSEFDPPAAEAAAADDVAAAIGTDERRMHVRAYNYWVSLLDGRDYPSIEDLEPGDVEDFASNSVLLDFTAGRADPATPYIGTAIREECGLGEGIKSTAEVPSRSLLSRLTDHYMQIIANRAPVGFEAEFVNQRGENICYRGILMPFSSDGDTIDFIYGVINWRKGESVPAAVVVPMLPEEEEPLELSIDDIAGPEEEPLELSADDIAVPFEEEPLELSAEDMAEPVEPEPEPALPVMDGLLLDEPGEIAIPEIQLDENAGLADWLCAARETAEAVKSADHRSRAALYRALSQAYDFALVAQDDPQEYAELLEESGLKAQARAPMTPIVKLVFGIDYDKTRLTEFASALAYAQRQNVGRGEFQALIDGQAGGLKALVAAERSARRPEPKTDTRGDKARTKLRGIAPIAIVDLPASEEFCLVLTRRGADGRHDAIAAVDDPAMLDRAIRRAAG
jgi:hypothetical protein